MEFIKQHLFLGVNVLLLILGIVLFVSTLRMRSSGQISELLLSVEEQKQCKNKKGYIDYIAGKEFLFAADLFLVGSIGIFVELKLLAIPYWNLIEMFIFSAGFFYFTSKMQEARKKFLHFSY